MRTVRFHREIYKGEAVDEAVKLLAKFAAFALTEEPTHWVVSVTSESAARERRVALELANHAFLISRR